MNSAELIKHIRQFCIENQNAENAFKAKRYFKESPDCYGITQPKLNYKTKQILKEKTVSLETVLLAMPEFFEGGKYEEITIGLLLVNGFEKQYTKELFDEIGSWFSQGIHNWAHADTLGMFVLPKFFKHKILSDNDFKTWLISPHKFQRRCVPVTLIKTLKSRDNFLLLFSFLEELMTDPEREVHQGMGWFLRECWKLRPAETEGFLLKWKDKAPRLIISYAVEKMHKEERERFRRKI